MSENGRYDGTVKYTMSAGPNSIHDRIRRAYSNQITYHYDPEFHALFDDTIEKLKQVYQTSGDVVIMQGEAVLGLEAASAGPVAPGDKCLNLVTGVFGAGYARYFKFYSGQDPLQIVMPYDQAIDPADVEKVLKEEGDVKYIAMVHSETPSGTLNPVKEIAALARQYGALTIVDAVSSIGGMNVPIDEWGVDICVGGPHKCLGASPGSALMAVSERAWEAMRSHPTPRRRTYLSLLDWKELWMDNRRFPFTVFVGQIRGVNEALTMVLEEGLQNRFERHARAARLCRTGARALGLGLWPASDDIMSTCVTAIKVPEGIDANQLIAIMRDTYGVSITGSLKELAGKVIRIGHMAHMAQPMYVVMALAALERGLYDLGYDVKLGEGVGAALAAM
jgi:pyridoxamine---pyruvate transaminase